MAPASYRDGVEAAYRGELAAEQLYRELARRADTPERQAKLDAIADVERLTHGRLQPIAERLGIVPSEGEWRSGVEVRARELGAMTWPAFIENALGDWPRYIPLFEALLPLAPPEDARTIQLLVDHEVALVTFIHAERAALTGTVSGGDMSPPARPLKVLEEFLAG